MKIILSIATSIIMATSAQAQTKSYGKWRVITNSLAEPPMALTVNDSDTGFGQVCSDDTDSCFWMILSPSTPCKKDEQTSVLANSSSGAYSFSAYCVGVFNFSGINYHRYVISPFVDVESMVNQSSGILSFAMPVNGGTFTVMRFDLNGSTKALPVLEDLKIKYFNVKKSKSTKNLNL